MISQDEATAMERAENQALITSQDACFNNFFFFLGKLMKIMIIAFQLGFPEPMRLYSVCAFQG